MKGTAMTMRTFTAVYQRDRADAWSARLAEEPAVISWGRTLAGAQTHLREAAQLWFDVDDLSAAGIELMPRIEVGALGDEVAALRARRGQLAEVEREVGQQTRVLARQLVDDGLSLRDVAAALGVSYQRVAQLVGPTAPEHRTSRRRHGAASG